MRDSLPDALWAKGDEGNDRSAFESGGNMSLESKALAFIGFGVVVYIGTLWAFTRLIITFNRELREMNEEDQI